MGSAHRARAAYRWSCDVSCYVSPDAQRRGVGKALYTRLIEILKLQGFHAAHAGIALPNAASVALHEAVGFRPVGVYEEVGFKNGSWRDVWLVEREAPGSRAGSRGTETICGPVPGRVEGKRPTDGPHFALAEPPCVGGGASLSRFFPPRAAP